MSCMVKRGMDRAALQKATEQSFLLKLAGLIGCTQDLLTFAPSRAPRQADSRLLAASDQFMAWTVGNDGIDPAVAKMIKQHWETRNSSQSRVDYIDAAAMVARRIHMFRARDFAPVVEHHYANGLRVPRKVIGELKLRRAEFAQGPVVVTPLAARSGFNMGWQPSRVPKAG